MVFVHSPKYTVIIICHLIKMMGTLNNGFKMLLTWVSVIRWVSFRFEFDRWSALVLSRVFLYLPAWQGERSRGPMGSLDQSPSDQSEARTASHEDTRLRAENHLKRQSEWLQVTSIYRALLLPGPSLVETDHVTWELSSDWPRGILLLSFLNVRGGDRNQSDSFHDPHSYFCQIPRNIYTTEAKYRDSRGQSVFTRSYSHALYH